jgi:uncharacterized membrane protein YbhN (UPF0104 family)
MPTGTAPAPSASAETLIPAEEIASLNGALETDHVERTVRRRLLTIGVLAAVVISLLLAVPGLRSVAHEISHVNTTWLILAGALELASCASFVVIFRQFFAGIAARQARHLAWTEMGSGALLPGGGVGSLALGGWLLHQAGMPTRKILRSSSGLFFLTSAVNVAALLAGALLLALGLSAGHHDLLRVGLPILAGSAAAAGVLWIARVSEHSSSGPLASQWVVQLVGGIGEVKRVLAHPRWRLLGALGYLGFDIAVLWATLTAVGYSPPISVLVLGYIIGYLANLIPVPGAIGVLEGGIAGTLVLYGAPLTQATAGVLIYHAIAFWIPSLGGIIAYRRLQLQVPATAPALDAHLRQPTFPTGGPVKEPLPIRALAPVAQLDSMPLASIPQLPAIAPARAASPVGARRSGPPRAQRTRGAMRSRHVEAHAVAWLRSLRDEARVAS